MARSEQQPNDPASLNEALKFWGKTLGIVAIGLLGLSFIL